MSEMIMLEQPREEAEVVEFRICTVGVQKYRELIEKIAAKNLELNKYRAPKIVDIDVE